MKTALIAGSTGLVGGQLLEELLNSNYYHRVIAISRQPLNLAHPILENVVTDLERLEKVGPQLTCDDVFCCLGTTMRKAGSKVAFRKIDFDYPLKLAELTFNLGAKQFLLVSALGANTKSGFYYNQVKGEVEIAISEIGFQTLHVLRPSLLMGNRKEDRAGEEAAKIFFKLFGFLVPSKYKGIASIKVARAMLNLAQQNITGKTIHESGQMQKY